MATEKKYNKVSFEPVERVQQRLGLNDREFCDALGYAGSPIAEWRKSGRAPKVAAIAAECLERRLSPEASARLAAIVGPTIMIIRADTPDTAAYIDLVVEKTSGAKVVHKIGPAA